MLIFTAVSYLAYMLVTFLMGWFAVNASALSSIIVIAIFAGVALLFIPGRIKGYGITVIVFAILFWVAVEQLIPHAGTVSIVLGVIFGFVTLCIAKTRIFKYLRLRGSHLPVWRKWVLRLI